MREDGTPYYIGKGSGRRIKVKQRTINPPTDKSRIVILKDCLCEEAAFEHEIELIALHGRKDIGTGILHNRTDGGEGASGKRCSDETKAKMSIARSGKKLRPLSDETKAKMSIARSGKNNPNYGKTASEETRRKQSIAQSGSNNPNYGKKLSDITKERIALSKIGKKHSAERRRQNSIAQSGSNNPNYGKKPSPETIAKRAETRKRNKEAKLLLENQLTSSTVSFGSDVW